MKYQLNKNKYLSIDELNHLYKLLENNTSKDAILITLALRTGARAQELLNITLKDLDDSNKSVFIKGLKNSNDREIPLNKSLYNALKALALNNYPKNVFGIGYSGLVDIWKKWTPNKVKSFKCLRHTCALLLYRQSKDILLVKALLGHSSIINTMVYANHEYETNQLKQILKY